MAKTEWENNGEANDEGMYVAVVDLEDGQRPQRFIGDSYRSVADQLMNAQLHASEAIKSHRQRLRELETPDTERAPRRLESRPLSADERFQVARDISDPTKADAAIKTVVEAEIGAPLSEVRERLNNQNETDQAAQAAEEARTFMAETPDFVPTPYNNQLLVANMQATGLTPTRKNFGIAFQRLRDAGLFQGKPDEVPREAIPSTRPRPTTTQSTGIRSTDSSGTPDSRQRQPKYTREQIERMPTAEYERRYRDERGFRELVDKLYATQAQA